MNALVYAREDSTANVCTQTNLIIQNQAMLILKNIEPKWSIPQ